MNTASLSLTNCIIETVNLLFVGHWIYGIPMGRGIRRGLLTLGIGVGLFLIGLAVTADEYVFGMSAVSFGVGVVWLAQKRDWLRLLSAQALLVILTLLLWMIFMAAGVISYEEIQYSRSLLLIHGVELLLVSGGIVLLRRFVTASFRFGSPREMGWFLAGSLAIIILLLVGIQFAAMNGDWAGVEAVMLFYALCSFVLVGICYGMADARYRNRWMELQQREAYQLLEAQERYYKSLLKKEAQTRAFRHDIRNHLHCMRRLCEAQEYGALQKYLEDFDEPWLFERRKAQSGNQLLDIMIADFCSRYPAQEVKLFGTFPEMHTLTDRDLCTIFSNLLANAFEASEQCDSREIALHIKTVDRNLLCTLTNRRAVTEAFDTDHPRSSKKESGHGYGLWNVRQCLEKYNGTLELSCEGDLVRADVILPNVIRDSSEASRLSDDR